ncbi:uncharacterized protein LOC116204137 [Punica granatum]|uniref:Uncharacterized protein LOC116204137 n=1 Tax=Punica granatum TaxID=22663 RepID=A0A6P8D685_PUNGR|nr:uncharacterized protein LOC116204137 [Punica granatum]
MVYKFAQDNDLGIFVIIETRVKEVNCKKIADGWKGWYMFENYQFAGNGRLWLMVREDLQVQILSKSAQFIHLLLNVPKGVGWIAVTFVYASNDMMERRLLWHDLQVVAGSMSHSWVLLGDFNAVKDIKEVKADGREIAMDQSMRDFADFMNSAELTDHTSIGCYYTWSNKRQEAMLKFGEKESAGPKPFKFFHFWTEHPKYMALVRRVWTEAQEGTPMEVLYKKLRSLKMHLKDFNRTKFGNVHTRINDLQSELAQVQATLLDSDCMPPELIKKEVDLRLEGVQEIKDEAINFYQGLLGKKDDCIGGISTSRLSSILKRKVPHSKHQMLMLPITDEEIKAALFSMGNDKSPRPDGYTAYFFKHAWQIVQKDFTNVVQHFFSSGKLRREVNSTIIALVPKKEKANCMRDFRPISCCNVVYKCISKVLANRLKEVLPDIISLNQTAFVQGRKISDNVLLAHELVRNYHRQGISPRCAIKIDLMKAFDSLSWEFILNSLEALDFPPCFLWWIKGCITSPYFSVAINGTLAGYFPGKRGVRQGDPISPYLFVIAMEVFSLTMDLAAAEGKVGYHPRCKSLRLTHLCFADDLLLFTNASKDSLVAILDVLNAFYHWSGLMLNSEKSEIFTGGISEDFVSDLVTCSGFKRGLLPVRYLGLPLVSGKLSSKNCEALTERIVERIKSWTVHRSVDPSSGKVSSNMQVGARSVGKSFASQKLREVLIKALMFPYIRYKVGSGKTVSFWYDTWLHVGPLIKYCYRGLQCFPSLREHATVSAVLVEGQWHWPRSSDPQATCIRDLATALESSNQDRVLWTPQKSGQFSIANAWQCLRSRGPKVEWGSAIWFDGHFPRSSFISWLSVHNKLATKDRLSKWGIQLASTECEFCSGHSSSFRCISPTVSLDLMHIVCTLLAAADFASGIWILRCADSFLMDWSFNGDQEWYFLPLQYLFILSKV